MEEVILQTKEKIKTTIKTLHEKLTKISVSAAHPSLLAGIMVEAYESLMPIEQVATTKTLDATNLVVIPFDKTLSKKIVSAINADNGGLNPIDEGNQIRINVPAVTSEKRQLFVKEAKNIGETFKISIRNIRQDANKHIKNEATSENETKMLETEVQDLVNNANKEIEEIIKEKIVHLTTI